jgi:hypothetical protein
MKQLKHPIATFTRADAPTGKKGGGSEVSWKHLAVNLTAWVHKECDIMDQDALLRLQGAWENPQQKEECSVRMDDLEWDYWMGTEVGQLG